MKKDGHIHTPFCPHGTKDPLDAYVERAIELGFQQISFTEHAPLPKGFVDTTPTKDSAMPLEQLDKYISEVNRVKEKYREKIHVGVGLEVDYIEGYEKEITTFLNEVGTSLDDAILSVHFLKFADDYVCIDYSPNVFHETVQKHGSVENIYDNYYRTVLQSIQADLGKFKPKRIGHITLVHKFQRRYPVNRSFDKAIDSLLHAVKEKNYELDYNGAGTAKPLCRETYPPADIAKKAIQMGIPLVYGSDAHRIKELGQGLKSLVIEI